MKTKFFILLFLLAATSALADGPVVQASPFMRQALRAPDSASAQSALGFTGTTTLSVISNTASLAAQPQFQNTSNTFLPFAYATKTNVFNVRAYGAFGDGVFAPVISITTNPPGECGAWLTCPNANFTPGDVGDEIEIAAYQNQRHVIFYDDFQPSKRHGHWGFRIACLCWQQMTTCAFTASMMTVQPNNRPSMLAWPMAAARSIGRMAFI